MEVESRFCSSYVNKTTLLSYLMSYMTWRHLFGNTKPGSVSCRYSAARNAMDKVTHKELSGFVWVYRLRVTHNYCLLLFI